MRQTGAFGHRGITVRQCYLICVFNPKSVRALLYNMYQYVQTYVHGKWDLTFQQRAIPVLQHPGRKSAHAATWGVHQHLVRLEQHLQPPRLLASVPLVIGH